MAKALRKGQGRRTLLDRVLGREPDRPVTVEFDPEAFTDRGDDVWKSLRV